MSNWEGRQVRECGEHRTTGGRAWCFDCGEWCSAHAPCVRCELPAMRRVAEAGAALVDAYDIERALGMAVATELVAAVEAWRS